MTHGPAGACPRCGGKGVYFTLGGKYGRDAWRICTEKGCMAGAKVRYPLTEEEIRERGLCEERRGET